MASREVTQGAHTQRLVLHGHQPDARGVDDDGSTKWEGPALVPAPSMNSNAPGWQIERRNVHEKLFPDISVDPVKVGRFELLRRLGRGGMGEVHVAYDEQLDREVALKLLLRERSANDEARERLLREAQVLARLSHPNVVQIYEAGVHDDQVFLVMERVEGITLRQWLSQAPKGAAARPWSEVLPVMIAAGRGLAAAHAAGLTHRDFKPDNVLVGDDGRVRVLDFGLARPGAEGNDDAQGSVSESQEGPMATMRRHSSSGSTRLDTRASSSRGSGSRRGIAQLTEPGRVVGTLAYMSPEQLTASPVDPRSDQFSFCVTLWEALLGERPFTGANVAAHLVAMTTQAPREPARSSVPRWLRALVRRGLAVEPDDRFADMDTLLQKLERPRGWAWKAGLAGAVVLAGVGTGWALSPTPAQPCELDQTALAGTWDPARRDALAAAFAIPGYSGDSAAAVERSLSDWSEAWLASLRSACEATRIAGTQSEAMLDRRSGCLERQRREADAIVDLLTAPRGAQRGHAFELLEQLPDAAVCDDPRLAQTPYPLPTQPKRREAILEAYQQLSHARALAVAGHLDQADALAQPLETTLETTVETTAANLDYLPLTLEAKYLGAQRSWWRGHREAGVSSLQAVIREAEIAGLDELSATLRTTLATKVVGHWGESTLQEIVLAEAETAVARVGRSNDRRGAALAVARAAWIQDSGDYDRALAEYGAIVEAARAAGDLVQHGKAQVHRGRLLVELGRFEDAEQAYLDARASFGDAYGRRSLSDARVELDLSYLDVARGRFEAAQTRLQNLRDRYASLLEPGSDVSTMVELAESKLAVMRGDFERASAGFARVVELGSDTVQRAEAWQALGVVRFYQGELEDSLAAYRHARAVFSRTLGPEHHRVGMLDSNIGESLAARGEHQQALAAFGKALDTLERALPPEHPDLAFPYKGRGQSRLALGDRTGARADLERALQLHEQDSGEPVERADLEFSLARALDEDQERERARALAESAYARLLEHGHDDAAATIMAWRDKNE
ncbi:MAG: serine/threonine-protein kinase [Myxococcota bacterium]